MEANKLVRELLKFSKDNYGLQEMDMLFVSNYLYNEFKVTPPLGDEPLECKDINDLVALMYEFYREEGLEEAEIEPKIGQILGNLAPRPNQVNDEFWKLYKKDPSLATSYLYKLGINMNYVQKKKIDQNEVWSVSLDEGREIELTINLSKPEKNNKDVAKLLTNKSVSYPKCALCVENLGLYKTGRGEGRTNIRFVELEFDNEKWYMQFSPYGYFDEHMILLKEEHSNMKMDRSIFSALLQLSEKFPHYTVGSNASLPIVGGSILNHEHFQGGKYLFPLLKAGMRKQIPLDVKDVELFEVDYYNYTLMFKSKSKEKLIEIVEKLENFWEKYSDESVDIIANDGVEHNVITPIIVNKDGYFHFYTILRNNRCNEEYPDGIFHVHPEFQAIKKEGIGLIEAMGRFILPARLKRQLGVVDHYASTNMKDEEIANESQEMKEFLGAIHYCRENKCSAKEYVNYVGREILKQVSVFKENDEGKAAAERMLKVFKESL